MRSNHRSASPPWAFIIFALGNLSRTERYKVLGIIVVILATVAMSASLPMLFAFGLDGILHQDGAQSGSMTYFILFALGIMLVGVLEQMQWRFFGPVNLSIQQRITLNVLSHVIALPLPVLRERSTYEIGRSVDRGLRALSDIVSNVVFFVAPAAVEIVIASTIIAYVINVKIAGVLFCALCAYGALSYFAASRIRQATNKAMDAGLGTWNFGMDGVANAELMQQGNHLPPFRSMLSDRISETNRFWFVTFSQNALFGSLQAVLFGSVVLFVLISGVNDVIGGSLSIGGLVLLNSYIVRLLQPVDNFAKFYRETAASLGECGPMLDLMAIAVPEQKGVSVGSGPLSLTAEKLTVALDGHVVLSELSLSVPAQSRLVVVGPSGSGKSTFLKIASALLVADQGTLSINGTEVTWNNVDAFRPLAKVVSQDCLLFDWSIRDNIAFGLDVSDDEIDDMARRLGLTALFDRHDGMAIDTVGEGGNRLSGGEKQRIALARALLGKPRLLLLDEPTSALDPENRLRVLAEIDAAARNATVILVTHDPDLIGADDSVLFLAGDGGWTTGRHADLMAENESYRRFLLEEPDQPMA